MGYEGLSFPSSLFPIEVLNLLYRKEWLFSMNIL